jgi:hypothetical protein
VTSYFVAAEELRAEEGEREQRIYELVEATQFLHRIEQRLTSIEAKLED